VGALQSESYMPVRRPSDLHSRMRCYPDLRRPPEMYKICSTCGWPLGGPKWDRSRPPCPIWSGDRPTSITALRTATELPPWASPKCHGLLRVGHSLGQRALLSSTCHKCGPGKTSPRVTQGGISQRRPPVSVWAGRRSGPRVLESRTASNSPSTRLHKMARACCIMAPTPRNRSSKFG